jgi:hypothetical protein
MAHDHGGCLFHGLCHGGQILLDLPAVVIGAQIFQNNTDITHTLPHRPKDPRAKTAMSTSVFQIPLRLILIMAAPFFTDCDDEKCRRITNYSLP